MSQYTNKTVMRIWQLEIEKPNSFHYWAVQQQSKARNLDSKYRQMALVGFDT